MLFAVIKDWWLCLQSKPTKLIKKAHKVKTKERGKEKNEGTVKDDKEKVPGIMSQSVDLLTAIYQSKPD